MRYTSKCSRILLSMYVFTTRHSVCDYDVVFSLVFPKTKPILLLRLKYCLTYFLSPCSISSPSTSHTHFCVARHAEKQSVPQIENSRHVLKKQLYSVDDFLKPPRSRTSAHKLLFTILTI